MRHRLRRLARRSATGKHPRRSCTDLAEHGGAPPLPDRLNNARHPRLTSISVRVFPKCRGCAYAARTRCARTSSHATRLRVATKICDRLITPQIKPGREWIWAGVMPFVASTARRHLRCGADKLRSCTCAQPCGGRITRSRFVRPNTSLNLSGLTISTSHGTESIIRSAVSPIAKRFNPRRLMAPITIMRAPRA